jgi:hypothetical protein
MREESRKIASGHIREKLRKIVSEHSREALREDKRDFTCKTKVIDHRDDIIENDRKEENGDCGEGIMT